MDGNSCIWFSAPASSWNEALPLGNGRLGAMVYGGSPKGGILQEQIQLNEDSLWSGGYLDRNNPDCYENLGEIRRLLHEGEIEKAQQLAVYAMTGTPHSQRCYQTLGDLYLNQTGVSGEITGYRRVLELDNACVKVSFSAGDVTYVREVFLSQPDQILVMRLHCDRPGALAFSVKMGRDRFFDTVWKEVGCRIGYQGQTGGADGIRFCCMAEGSCDGSLRCVGEYLVVENATEAMIRLSAATSFREQDPLAACRRTLDRSRGKSYGKLFEEHLREYRSYDQKNRLTLSGSGQGELLPTGERLQRFGKTGEDNGLFALYHRFGRYLLIASSRPGSLPANLQGIWCDQIKPSWDSKYTININTEMNYWPAESCGLSQCHLPLFEHMRRMYPHGQQTAWKMYHAGGWVAHHNTDLWGDTAPQDTYVPATYWVMGAAWLCTHIWEHYLYTLDGDFLAEYYELMRESCRFFLDVLVQDDKGRLVITPTCSPENTYLLPQNGHPAHLCEGCAMDSQILHELFNDTICAAALLQKDEAFSQQLSRALQRLPKIQIDDDGRIMEWLEPYQEREPGHRHISHLFGLYPGHQIDAKRTPELAEAARKTLEYRLSHGGGHTGWSRAWIINFWAQLGDAQKVQENLELLLTRSTLPNLFDNHPPFQIDGNFGGTAGITRAILQSSYDPLSGQGEILLLPALPPKWNEGSLLGAGLRGGVTGDIYWKNGFLEKVTLTACADYRGVLRWKGQGGQQSREIALRAGESAEFVF